jgi:trehalose 6-phosphate synthase
MLPSRVARQVLRGLLGADRVAFHTRRWADAFGACCEAVCRASYDGDRITHEHGSTEIGIHPLGVDGEELRARAGQSDVAQRQAALDQWLGDKRLILRIDRTELSKNIVRGIAAYRELLRGHPELHGEVVHLVLAYPSRHDLPEYREYTGAVQRIATDVNDELATGSWTPLVLAVDDDYPRSLAAMSRADVLVTNPVRDGMNLVAKEGPILSRDGLGLVLSRDAGAVDELGDAAYLVNPFDVTETAAAMHAALSATPAERRSLTDRLVTAATAAPPQRWLAEQLDALG